MDLKNFVVCGSAISVLLFSSGWLDGNFARRTPVDVDNFRHPAGKNVMLTLDAVRLGRAAKAEFAPDKIKLGFTSPAGKEQEIAFASNGVDPIDKKLRISFVMPQEKGKVHLYFDGKTDYKPTAYPDVLAGNGINAAKYKSDGKLKVKSIKNGLNISQNEIVKTTRKSVNISAEQIFAVAPEYAGMPVTLIFDGYNYSKSMWPLAVSVYSLDANKKVIGEMVCDLRWTLMQAPPEKPFHIRQAGKLDPRAKYVRVSLVVHRANEERPYDVNGRLLPDFKTSLPNMDITRLELIPGYQAELPGANPELYTEGVKPGTSAVKFGGNTSLLYNNFPANVWSAGAKPRNQEMIYFPTGNEGTAEFYLKFDEIPGKEVILFDNARNNIASFLRLDYNKGKLVLKMNGYGTKAKKRNDAKKSYELTKSSPVKLSAGKWIHFAIVWSKSGAAVFVDGKKVISDPTCVKPAQSVLNNQDKRSKDNIAEYTCIGADGHRYYDNYNGVANNNYFKGAADELRVSNVARYTANFTPAKEFEVDKNTCALFSYEKNFDGTSAVGSRYISGSIFSGDVPPRADVFEVEDKNGKTETVRYVPKDIPDSNMPEYHICQTSYPVLPSAADFRAARISKSVKKRVNPGDKIEYTTPEHTVPEYIEIKAVNTPVKAPMLFHDKETDARSFADIARTLDFTACPTDHTRARKIFDFLVRSTDYYTFPGAEFVKYSNKPMHAAQNGLVAINSYACFQCGPLNGIASGLFTNGLGFQSVLTFGNGHLFQQVMVDGKLRVFDLSAQKYWPSRDQDDAASLDEMEKDVYLFYRTVKKPRAVSHFFRMGSRGAHSVANPPRERLDYTLYPGESFRYYPASCGYTQDISALTWDGKRHSLDTWTDMQNATGASIEVGRTIQRLLPHTSQGIYKYDGKVTEGAFSKVTDKSFCYRIDSPYTVIHGVYSVPDKNATFELSYDKGKNWRKLESSNGICIVEFAMRGRHAGLLKVNTKSRQFKAMTVTQMSPRRQTGLTRAGKNSVTFAAESGSADVTIAYRERAGEIVLEGGFYSGCVPGLERQLFTLEPGKSRIINVTGVSANAKVKTSGGLNAELKGGKLTITAPDKTAKGFKYIIITDGNAVKAADILVCKGIKEFGIKDFKGKKSEVRKADASRPQDAVAGTYKLDISDLAPGKYVIFTLTRRDNRQQSMIQAYISHRKKQITAARYRNPSFDFYKAKYGPLMARLHNRSIDPATLDPWSRMRWDTSTGKDTYPRMLPLEIDVNKGEKPLVLKVHSADCFGVIVMPSSDRQFMYFTIANLHHMSRADWMFDGYLEPIY